MGFLIRLEDFRSVFNHLTWCFRGSVMLSPCTWHDGFNVIWRSKSSTIHPEFPPRDLRARHPRGGCFLWNSLDMFFGNGPRHFKTCLLICSPSLFSPQENLLSSSHGPGIGQRRGRRRGRCNGAVGSTWRRWNLQKSGYGMGAPIAMVILCYMYDYPLVI